MCNHAPPWQHYKKRGFTLLNEIFLYFHHFMKFYRLPDLMSHHHFSCTSQYPRVVYTCIPLHVMCNVQLEHNIDLALWYPTEEKMQLSVWSIMLHEQFTMLRLGQDYTCRRLQPLIMYYCLCLLYSFNPWYTVKAKYFLNPSHLIFFS